MKFWHAYSLVINRAKKFNLTILAFPMNTYVKGKKAHLTTGHLVIGEEKAKQAYFDSLKKDKRIKNLEIEGDFAAYSFEASMKESHLQMYFTPEIMFIKPVVIKPDGFEYIEIASWNKENLTNFFKKVKKWLKIESFSIKNEKITDIYIPHLMPKLTEKQKKAVLLAFQNGYYDYPKKVNIGKLAKAMKLSPSTFQEHLRRAEEKLMPFLLENLLSR